MILLLVIVLLPVHIEKGFTVHSVDIKNPVEMIHFML